MAAGARPLMKIWAVEVRYGASGKPISLTLRVMVTWSGWLEASSLMNRRWRPAPRSRFSTPRTSSVFPVRNMNVLVIGGPLETASRSALDETYARSLPVDADGKLLTMLVTATPPVALKPFAPGDVP